MVHGSGLTVIVIVGEAILVGAGEGKNRCGQIISSENREPLGRFALPREILELRFSFAIDEARQTDQVTDQVA
jgi:hypothetical protein